jgi:hypothetical protein
MTVKSLLLLRLTANFATRNLHWEKGIARVLLEGEKNKNNPAKDLAE